MLFFLAIDNLDNKNFGLGDVMVSVLGDKRAVWNMITTNEPIMTFVPIELLFHMVPDPKVRDWLLVMKERELLEKI